MRPSRTSALELVGRHVLDVALAAVDSGDHVGGDVHEHDRAARLREGLREREADVAGADDRDLGRRDVGAAARRLLFEPTHARARVPRSAAILSAAAPSP